MTKKVLQMRNLIMSVLIVETLLLFVLYLWLSNSILLILSVYSLIKNIVLFIAIGYLSYLIDTNYVGVAEVLDQDSKNAFLFGGVGLIQYDETRNVVWTSDLFQEMGVNVVGVKLLEWQPKLASLFEDEDIKVVDIKGKKFEAYNNKKTKLIYFKDRTQYLSLQQDYADQQMCMAYITIDNYEETLGEADEPKTALIQSKTRQVIVDWAYSNGIILRRYKSGGYIAFFNERIYRKQVDGKFSVLDTFNEMSKELDEVMTLSIGIGREAKVLRELDELATSALSLTYSRGGDQVAVKSGDENVQFYGGNTDTSERSSKVRARVIAQSLAGLIKNANNVLIMGHNNSDMDSFGASVAAMKIAQAYEKPVNIVINPDSLEEKTEHVVLIANEDERYRDIIISPNEALENVTRDTLLIVVDHHKPSLTISNALLERVKNKVVIDHHRRGEEFIDAPVLTYLESSASSTVELLVELCEYQKVEVKMNDLDATIMYAGILVDTNGFKQRVGVRTFQSAAFLKNKQANVNMAHEFLEDSYEETIQKTRIIQSAYTYRDVMLIAVGEEDEEVSRTLLAKASNTMLEVSHIKATFSIARVTKTKVAMSARSTKDVNVQVIMEKLGGGGHFSMAATVFEDKSIEEVRVLLEETIDEYFKDRGEE